MTPDEVEAVAGKLPTGAARACVKMTADWQFPGKATFNANGAHSLYWAKTGMGRGALVDRALLRPDPEKRVARDAYRLTPLGLAVKAHLERQR